MQIKFAGEADLLSLGEEEETKIANKTAPAHATNFMQTSAIVVGDSKIEVKNTVENNGIESTFDADKWFYADELNDGTPMLRQFFWQQQLYGSQDVLAQLEKLGYTKYTGAA